MRYMSSSWSYQRYIPEISVYPKRWTSGTQDRLKESSRGTVPTAISVPSGAVRRIPSTLSPNQRAMILSIVINGVRTRLRSFGPIVDHKVCREELQLLSTYLAARRVEARGPRSILDWCIQPVMATATWSSCVVVGSQSGNRSCRTYHNVIIQITWGRRTARRGLDAGNQVVLSSL